MHVKFIIFCIMNLITIFIVICITMKIVLSKFIVFKKKFKYNASSAFNQNKNYG